MTLKNVADNAETACLFGQLDNATNPVDFTVNAATGALFPDPPFWLTAWNRTLQENPTYADDREVLLVTAKTGDHFTASRGQEGTAIVPHQGITALRLEVMAGHIRALNAVVSGAGNTDTFSGDGFTATFSLGNVPNPGSTRVYIDGIRCFEGVHYTVSGLIITFIAAPGAGWDITVDYSVI